MNFDVKFFIYLLPLLFQCIKITLSISIISFFIALALSLILAVICNYKIRVLCPIAKAYVYFFRGTPLLAQIFFIYFGLPYAIPAFKNMGAFTAAIIAISLNSAAYMTETIRAAIISVDKGQIEAAFSVGMTNIQSLRRIIFPQAARIAIPPLSNNFVDIIKGSSIAFTIGVPEIMAKAKMEAAASYKFFEAYAAVMIVYFIIIFIFNNFQNLLEKKISKAY